MVRLRYVTQWSPMSIDIRLAAFAADEVADHRVRDDGGEGRAADRLGWWPS
jgi:hypothetical protein